MSRHLRRLQSLPLRTHAERNIAEQRIKAAYLALANKLRVKQKRLDGSVELRAARGTRAEFDELMKIRQMGMTLRAMRVKHHEISEVEAEFYRLDRNFWKAEFNAASNRHVPFVPKPNKELNDNIIRLRDEVLPDCRQRTWMEVRLAIREINPDWNFPPTKSDPEGTAKIRMRYMREKRKKV